MVTRNAPPARGSAAPPPAAEASPNAIAVPAKKSKLQVALDKANEAVTKVQSMAADIEELERTSGPSIAFAVSTKEGRALADGARKTARQRRLDLKAVRDESTKMFNGLKQDLWEVIDPFIAKLQAIENNAKTQLEAESNKEAERKQAHEETIAAIGRMTEGMSDFTEEQMLERRAAVEKVIVDESFQEFQQKAAERKAEVLALLDAAIDMERKRKRAAACMEIMRGWKALPEELKDTGAENITEALRILRAQEPTLETFGEMLDFATMAHQATVTLVKAMLAAEQAAPAGGDVDDEEGLAGFADVPAIVVDPATTAPAVDEDPFTKPVPGPTVPTISVGRSATPAPRGRAPTPRGTATTRDVVAPLSAQGMRADEPFDNLREERLNIAVAPASEGAPGALAQSDERGSAADGESIQAPHILPEERMPGLPKAEPGRLPQFGSLPGYHAEGCNDPTCGGCDVPDYVRALLVNTWPVENVPTLQNAVGGVLHLFALLPRHVTAELEDAPIGRGLIRAMRYMQAALEKSTTNLTP